MNETRHTPSNAAKTPMCREHPAHFPPCTKCHGYDCAACDNAALRSDEDDHLVQEIERLRDDNLWLTSERNERHAKALATIEQVRALADALTEDNAYDDAALESANVSVSEAQTYPAIISERTSVIQRLRAALDTEATP